MEKHFKNAFSMIGIIGLIFMIGTIFYTEAAIQAIYIYMSVMLIVIGITCGAMIPAIHEYYSDKDSFKPHLYTAFIGIALVVFSYYLTIGLFEIKISFFIYALQFLILFSFIYFIAYLWNRNYSRSINTLLAQRTEGIDSIKE